MKHVVLIIGLIFLSNSLIFGQNLFPEKFDDCNFGQFCLDCGETKGGYSGDLTEYFVKTISPKKIKGLNESILVQVLIDTLGKQCVKSVKNNIPELGLKDHINSMKGWQPAKSKGIAENVSITLKIEIKDGIILVSYQRFDPSKVTNMKSEGSVEITNKNTNLKNTTALKFEVFTMENTRKLTH